MRPGKVRRLLEEHGEITNLYLAAAEKSASEKRRDRSKRFTEGWVEFAEKKIAKRVAASLNCTPIGAGRHAEDLWAVKYLRGFEWRHLTEKQAYDRRVKADRLRVEFAQSQRDASEYLGLVDQRDKVNAIKKRKRKRADDKDKG
mmetsp:Transcript_1218/g.3666  ORF Transcript_1218/g.3666 Transcript_1218/m.3666 type:complete len:144 (+) Transcript_1218:1-432(+)